MENIIFNCSLPRSGSELLQVILSQHPDVYASATSPLLEFQFAARGNMELPEVRSQDAALMADAFVSMCGGMAKSYYQVLTDKPIVIDKNRGWAHYFEWVEQWCPDPKMVCMVRDPRAIIWSFEKAYRANRHLPTGPDNPAELVGMTFMQRAHHWLNNHPFGLALLRLQDCFQKGLDGRILYVRYEGLVTAPQETINEVAAFAGITHHDYDFDNLEKTVQEDSSVYGVFGDHSVAKSIDASKIDEWKANMPVEVSELITNQVGWFIKQLNY